MGWTSDRVVVEDTSKGVNFSSDFIYLRIWGCAGSSSLRGLCSSCKEQQAPLWLWCWGFSCGGLSCCRTQALGTWVSVASQFPQAASGDSLN